MSPEPAMLRVIPGDDEPADFSAASRQRSTAARQRGYTVADIAARHRVSPARVRAWIAQGLLRALDTSACDRPQRRYVVTPEALAAFEAGREVRAPQHATRRRRPPHVRDYYPDS